MTFPDAVFAALRDEPGRVVVEHESRQVTTTELLDMVARIAGGLRARGVKRGTGIAMDTSVTPEAIAAYLAGYALGAMVVGIRPGFSAKQLEHIRSAGVTVMVTDDEIKSLLATESEPLLVTSRPQDVARLVYTSGSTGLPKGCVFTYESMTPSSKWRDAAGLAGRMDRHLVFGSLASAVVYDYMEQALLQGGVIVIADEPRFPAVIEKYRITFTIMNVPRLYAMLDSLRDNPVDTSSLKGMLVAGSPLAPHRLAEAVERFGPVVFQGYGQSEAGSLTLLTPSDISSGVLRSVGRPVEGVEIDIRDGEIWVRHPALMREYWDNAGETAAVLVDGWLRTRDIGRLDDGFLYLTGRARDVVIVGGYPVYLGPVEGVLATHPDVDQAYVVGSADEQIHAFVIPVAGREPSVEALSTLVETELGPASVPVSFRFVASVPIAASGKPDKQALLGE
ncbi:long-chain fatty acid--CoA ligase [Actinocrispum sp. NPDC049592]|uniref:class I adenylate-forming enzyme family protein n=1 Tax=Actinocrispum sp. NPDC049592 TaxID=3154835 RepID=UPI00342A6C20